MQDKQIHNTLIIGAGGAGCDIAKTIAQNMQQELLLINTYLPTLDNNNADSKIFLGFSGQNQSQDNLAALLTADDCSQISGPTAQPPLYFLHIADLRWSVAIGFDLRYSPAITLTGDGQSQAVCAINAINKNFAQLNPVMPGCYAVAHFAVSAP